MTTTTTNNELSAQLLEAIGTEIDRVLRQCDFPRGSCVLVARLMIDVLDRLGIEAVAVPVRAIALSPGAESAMDKGSSLDKAMVRNPVTGAGIGRFGLCRVSRAYDGHILVKAGDLFVDQTADQFSNQRFGISLAPMSFRSESLSRGRTATVENVAGSRIVYVPMGDSSHELSLSWKPSLHSDRFVDGMVAVLEGNRRATRPTRIAGGWRAALRPQKVGLS